MLLREKWRPLIRTGLAQLSKHRTCKNEHPKVSWYLNGNRTTIRISCCDWCNYIIKLFVCLVWVIPISAHGLLTPSSAITSGGALGTILGAKDQTQVRHVQGKCSTCYTITPATKISNFYLKNSVTKAESEGLLNFYLHFVLVSL